MSLTAAPVALIEVDPTQRAALAEHCKPAVAVPTTGALDARLAELGRAVLVFGPSYADEVGLADIAQTIQIHEPIGVVLVVEQWDTDLARRASAAGVGEMIVAATDGTEFRRAVAGMVLTEASAGPLVSPADVVGAETAGAPGRVIAVFSPKGGVGRSVIATNLAVALAPRCDAPVVLVDADLRGGDVAVMLRMAPVRTVVDAVDAVESSTGPASAAMLRSQLMTHSSSGLLVAPVGIHAGTDLPVSILGFRSLIRALRTFAAFTIIDLPAEPSRLVSALCQEADGILAIALPDMASVKSLTLGLAGLVEDGVAADSIRLAINRFDSPVYLDLGDVERTVGYRSSWNIPSDIAVPRSINLGVPAVLDVQRSNFAASVLAFAHQLLSTAHAGATTVTSR